jgi:hypothetical protein
LSGLWQQGNRLSGDIRGVGTKRKRFELEIMPDQKAIRLERFREAIELLGISTPVEQNNLFTGHLGASEGGIYRDASGNYNQLNIAGEPIN